MNDTFPLEDFDEWAPTYDQNVRLQGFPFAGYEHTLDEIVKEAEPKAGMKILDLGAGTGNLTGRFLTAGCSVTGVDYSGNMIEIAKAKYPAATYLQADLRSNPESFLPEQKFDRVVSAYTFHHFTLTEKYQLLKKLVPFLASSSYFVIGDVAFQDDAALQVVSENAGDEWEDEEYWLADHSIEYLAQKQMQVSFVQTSNCAGVFKIMVFD